jgi:hypothetical protein
MYLVNNLIEENKKDMKNSYVKLHRDLDTQIQALESQPHPNLSFITDLKKKKLQLKEHIELGSPLSKGAIRKYDSMIQSHKLSEKNKRRQRKIVKHQHDEALRKALSQLAS